MPTTQTTTERARALATTHATDRRRAGALLVAGGAVALLGIITAEALYPGYSSQLEISDLGASRPPNSVIVQPAATVFNATMLLTGLALLAGAALAHRAVGRRRLTVPLALYGLGALGVGLFPGNVVPWHGLSAMLAFVAGGVTALAASTLLAQPFRWLGYVAGAVSLAMLALVLVTGLSGLANPFDFLSLGGVERWVVYPVLLWLVAFGGYLLGDGPVEAVETP